MFDPYLSFDRNATPSELVKTSDFERWLARQAQDIRHSATRQGFKAESGQHCWLPHPSLVAVPGNAEAKAAFGRSHSALGEGGAALGWSGQSTLATLGGLPLALQLPEPMPDAPLG